MRGLDLFSGIGGISLALQPWVKTVAYCECEPYAQAVLLERMQSNDLDSAPIWDDVRTLNRTVLDTKIDIIFGGFPCQDISVAGSGEGLEGKRSGLFFEIARLAKEYRPRFVFLENVPAICSRGGIEVIETLTALRYDCRWIMLSAAEVGAPHKRERWWLLAYANSARCERTRQTQPKKRCCDSISVGASENVAYSDSSGFQETRPEQQATGTFKRGGMAYSDSKQTRRIANARGELYQWESEPAICRVVNGLPYRVERIKALGNSVVPQAAREAFVRLLTP